MASGEMQDDRREGMRFGFRFAMLSACLFLSSACVRPAGKDASSRVLIQTPDLSLAANVSTQSAIPTGQKACYGVSVTGEGIGATAGGGCGLSVGASAGFVEGSSTLSLELPRGSDRTFELFIYLVSTTESCPKFDPTMLSKLSDLKKIYRSGKTSGVTLNQDQQNVTINVLFPGEEQSLFTVEPAVASCSMGSMFKGSLLSSGDVIDGQGNDMSALSSLLNAAFYFTGLGGDFGVGTVSNSYILNLPLANAVVTPPEVFSVTRKPDSGVYYGLLHSGKIVSMDVGTGFYTELDSSHCPFAVTNCEAPVWMQSISAGTGDELYGLDQGGNIYLIRQADVDAIGVQVPANVVQVSFY
jgi:hypothetical protein